MCLLTKHPTMMHLWLSHLTHASAWHSGAKAYVLQITLGGPRATFVPIFSPRCMHSAWDYILQLLLQTMNSRRHDGHLAHPRMRRKIQIKDGRKHRSDLLASCVCVGCMLVKVKQSQASRILLSDGHGSGLRAFLRANPRTPSFLSLSSWLVNLFAWRI